jgi:serine phosphatase RsbU (regulator of sigma subunit)/pSer/pThr/pTyr-binding forkhead associated (FHA) protein
MASLQVIKGANQGQEVAIEVDQFILGRNPDCHLVIPITSVSREHAQILRVQDKFFIEDKQSRNHTFVNDQQVMARTELKDKDRVKICDFIAVFLDGSKRLPLPAELARGATVEELDTEEDAPPVPEATISSHSSHLLLETQPREKLNALLEISGKLSKTLEIDPLLPKIVDILFQLFRQADRGFIILLDEATGRLIPKVVKTRRAQDEINARFSKSIVRQCMESLQAVLSDDAAADRRFALSQSVADFRIKSVMCAPLVSAEGKAFGVIQLDTQDRSKKFVQDDLAMLVGVANQAAIALENAKLHEQAVARERLRKEVELAHQVQMSFLPRELPMVPGYEFYAHYESAQEVGGDYYGFIPMQGARLAITLGDVAGKGVPAALLMAKLSSDTRFCLLTEQNMAKAIGQLNDLLYSHTSQMDRFVTLGGAVLDPATHEVTLVSAGHLSPLLYSKAKGQIVEIMSREATGLPLGMLEAQEYESCKIKLEPGDWLMVFSDGVPDSYSLRNEGFQMKGVYAALASTEPLSARVAGERVVAAVKKHAAGRSPHDDVTLISFGRTA